MSIKLSQSLATSTARPQIGIDRLPARRVSHEPREAMNCKSCRKRKIKCNRTRPTCEACQVFNCPCIYDAVPKKRGPKTDVLEALLKRVDGLEKRLVSEGKSEDPTDTTDTTDIANITNTTNTTTTTTTTDSPLTDQDPPLYSKHSQTQAQAQAQPQSQPQSQSHSPHDTKPTPPPPPPPPPPQTADQPSHAFSPPRSRLSSPTVAPNQLLDTYFAKLHRNPYYVLDEATTKQRLLANQLPGHVLYAIYAVSARYTPSFGSYNVAVQASQEYARRARMELDIDEPSIETLQTLLLLILANSQLGKGKTTYMLLTLAISMAFALDLHRELPRDRKSTLVERESRRQLFWSCYLMDRFAATGSRRPSLIADESIALRLPSWQLHPGAMLNEGDFFANGCSSQILGSNDTRGQGSTGILIGISRILGIANRYLAAGGIKGDSHLPWHSLSTLSKIRQELDIWASETQEALRSIDTAFEPADSMILVLSKLIYHVIHCLIYRPFLPVSLAELSSASQHQHWQIEATNLCFLHADSIAELTDAGRVSSITEWPAFVSYCICTAGTIHTHGAHYPRREGEVYSASAEFLSREMQQLSELCNMWASAQHQRDTLQVVVACHAELIQSLESSSTRYAPVFQLEDFFDRYPDYAFDGAHLSFLPIGVESGHEALSESPVEQRNNRNMNIGVVGNESKYQAQPTLPSQAHFVVGRPSKRRRATTSNKMPPSHQMPVPLTPMATTNLSIQHMCQEAEAAISHSDASSRHARALPDNTSVSPYTPALNDSLSSMPISNTCTSGLTFPANFKFSPLCQFPNLASSPVPRAAILPSNIDAHSIHFDSLLNMPTPYDQLPTSEGGSTSCKSAQNDAGSKDPFLCLLEQLAENETSRAGPSEMNYLLSGQNG